MIDTHCHLNFEAYNTDREAVIERAAQAGVARIINPGIDLPSSRAGIELTQQHTGIYAAVAIHPNSSTSFASADTAALKALASSTDRVVAIGEIGLDYYWDKSP